MWWLIPRVPGAYRGTVNDGLRYQARPTYLVRVLRQLLEQAWVVGDGEGILTTSLQDVAVDALLRVVEDVGGVRGTWKMEERARGGQSRGKASREGRHQLAGEFPEYPRHVAEVRVPDLAALQFQPDFVDRRKLKLCWLWSPVWCLFTPTLLSTLCMIKRENNRPSPCICVGRPIPSLWLT